MTVQFVVATPLLARTVNIAQGTKRKGSGCSFPSSMCNFEDSKLYIDESVLEVIAKVIFKGTTNGIFRGILEGIFGETPKELLKDTFVGTPALLLGEIYNAREMIVSSEKFGLAKR